MEYKNKEIILTRGQQKALEEVIIWFEEDKDEQFKTLMGFSGSGKSVTLDYITQALKSRNNNIVITATTNKAVKVLIERINHSQFMTIHSLLNIKPKRKRDKEIFEPVKYNKKDISAFDLIIIDECSMISKKLMKIIKKELKEYPFIKVLFCGDPAQLEPVNEEISKTFSYTLDTKLTQVVRHGDIISNTAKVLRNSKKLIEPKSLIHEPIISYIERDYLLEIFKTFRENPNNIRMLCWTNEQVKKWNFILRESDYGYSPEKPFMVGDIVMANDTCLNRDDIIMNNSEEGVIANIREHDKYYWMEIRKELGGFAYCHVLKKEYENDYDEELKAYAKDKNWSSFWALKKFYHDIRHCYSLTCHKSQGSTFTNVAIDIENLYLNRNIQNRNQLLYVAMTRATDNIWFY